MAPLLWIAAAVGAAWLWARRTVTGEVPAGPSLGVAPYLVASAGAWTATATTTATGASYKLVSNNGTTTATIASGDKPSATDATAAALAALDGASLPTTPVQGTIVVGTEQRSFIVTQKSATQWQWTSSTGKQGTNGNRIGALTRAVQNTVA